MSYDMTPPLHDIFESLDHLAGLAKGSTAAPEELLNTRRDLIVRLVRAKLHADHRNRSLQNTLNRIGHFTDSHPCLSVQDVPTIHALRDDLRIHA